jgi:hypothetical protein
MSGKKIKVLSSGLISIKGGIYGPILTPYEESFETIFQLIAGGYKVVEVKEDGTEVPLTILNYDEIIVPEKPVVEKKAPVEQPKQAPAPQQNNQNNNQNNKFNKNNNQKNNNQNVQKTEIVEDVLTEKK